ncbi:MAG TPA: zinc metalloprotease, partial [Saprospiraceae bacterium]|nr:zinc metalloprotease [Saprospiraceae bacterium]
MLRNLLLALGAFLLLASPTYAQRMCAAEEHLQHQLEHDPLFREARELIERQTQDFILNGGVKDRVQVTIPVVVHVLWNTTAQNISQSQIQSQLDVLNADFRKLNADIAGVPSVWQGLTADMEINFCLATQDNNGAATTGVERRQTSNTSWSANNNNMKFYSSGGLDAWNRDKYLNIWVCNLSGGILGFATFPGGAANVDGVVITTTGFGTNGTATAPFNKGRTATHEVGHWLNLYHIWGDDGTGCTGTDQVADTPNQADENYGCPVFPQVSCSNGPNGDMFMNYMDYTDDACMYMFTAGQKTRS